MRPLTQYDQLGRYYHNLQHAADCIRLISRDFALSDGLTHYDELILAALYHDCIYVPGAKDNEAQSANAASAYLTGVNGFVVRNIIMATRHLGEPLATIEEQIMADVDLAGLGADSATYRRVAADIRLEAGCSLKQWWEGRVRFLEMMLARPSIYYTELYRARLEQTARANMQAELHRLEEIVAIAVELDHLQELVSQESKNPNA